MDDDWRRLNVCCHYHQWRFDIPWWITIHDVNDCGDDKNDDGGDDDNDEDEDDDDDDDDNDGGGGGFECYIEWSCKVINDGYEDYLCFVWCW